MKLRYLRWITLAATFVIITAGLVLNTSLGTLSSLGWQAIAAICPLGALESFLASKSFFLRTLIVFAAAVILTVALGKVFCAWVCPVAPVRTLLDLIARRRQTSKLADKDTGESKLQTTELAAVSGAVDQSGSGCAKDCSTCASKRAKLDSRHLVLAGSLLSAAIFGFPVFCLVCPIGLIFGTIIVVWQFIGFDDVSLSLLIYPALLIVELLVLRKWCAKFCPLGALLSLLSLPNRLLRPKVDTAKCLRAKGADCHVCQDVCPEGIDPHFSDGLHECSKCALCKDECPSKAITIPLRQK
ncbi:MAG: 4Fe-4S binding protein [Coriobacteriales bacterium]|jgi:ferredoxin-type protein NapH|nr:4Fe-4S binding protein [Coriobacteriales bacterium]